MSSLALSLTFDQVVAGRKRLQKLEFFAWWTIIFFAATSGILQQFGIFCTSTGILYHCSSTYIKLSTFTRVIAYAIDFANAWIRFGGAIPLWLILHHSGVCVQHILHAVVLLPAFPREIALVALGMQSSHNTWTKKYSLVLYWVNCLLGLLSIFYLHSLDGRHLFWSNCSYYAFLICTVGVALLGLGELDSRVEKKHV